MKKNGFLRKVAILVLLIGAGLFGVYRYGPNVNVYLFPPSPQQYGTVILQKLDQFGLYAHGDKWDKSYKSSLRAIKKSSSYVETRKILSDSLSVAGGNHSSLWAKDDLNKAVQNNSFPETKLLDKETLYLKLPEFIGADEEQMTKYAKTIHKASQSNAVKQVIVDLSNNRGGNMAPMLIGITNLLPDGTLFTFESRDNQKTKVVLKNNSLKDHTMIDIGTITKKKNIPVAIITNENTASSGELVALAFKGLKNVRYFGHATAGYTSVNRSIYLYDGAVLNITNARVISRDKVVYENQAILPNQETNEPIAAAQKWFKNLKH
ncbi:S41 family peptidase [Streptococcus pluranimalium]